VAQARMVYHVRDSDTCGNGVHFNWVSALEGNRWDLEQGDPILPEYVSVSLPEPFLFYNQAYDHLWINDHATVLFSDDNFYDDPFPSGTPPIPNPTVLDPNNAIYVAWGTSFWHPPDQDPDAAVYTYHDTSNGRNWFIVEYYKYTNLLADDPDEDTMAVILDLDTYEITVQYESVTYSDFAVAGIENQGGSEGILYVHDQAPAENSLHDGLAIRYGLGEPPVILEATLDPLTASETGELGGSVDYLLTLSNTGSISDSYTLEATGNKWPITFYDATFTTPITTLGPLPSCQSSQFGVRVQIPAYASGVQDVATVRARSQTDTLIAAASVLTTNRLGSEQFIMYQPVYTK
jgi:hypothetical protein